MNPTPARTIDALRLQVVAAGWSRRDLDRLMDAHDVALEAHAHVLTGTGRPMVSHGIGTAALAVHQQLEPVAVLAAVVHTVPTHGRTGVTWSSRARWHGRIGQQLGTEVAALCEAYLQYHLDTDPAAAGAPRELGHTARCLHVLSRLDHLTLAGPLHRTDPLRALAAAVEEMPRLCVWADGLGLDGVAEAVRTEVAAATALGETILIGSPGRYGDGHAVVNEALRQRTTARLVGRAKARMTEMGARPARRHRPPVTSNPTAAASTQAQPPADPGGQWPHGRVVAVVGVGVIGRAIADQCHRAGATVHQIDRDPTRLTHHGDRAVTVAADVTDPEALTRAWDRICAGGAPEVVFITVGGAGGSRHLSEIGARRWHDTLTLNLVAPALVLGRFAATRTAAGGGGVAVLFGSLHGERASTVTDYAAAKAAVTKLVADTALELAPEGVRVVGVAPGWTELGPDGDPRLDANNPRLGTSIEPAAVAHFAITLATPGMHVSGQMVRFDDASAVRHPEAWR